LCDIHEENGRDHRKLFLGHRESKHYHLLHGALKEDLKKRENLLFFLSRKRKKEKNPLSV
jgi:hypothetical protein